MICPTCNIELIKTTVPVVLPETDKKWANYVACRKIAGQETSKYECPRCNKVKYGPSKGNI
jgi:hypothetical protein